MKIYYIAYAILGVTFNISQSMGMDSSSHALTDPLSSDQQKFESYQAMCTYHLSEYFWYSKEADAILNKLNNTKPEAQAPIVLQEDAELSHEMDKVFHVENATLKERDSNNSKESLSYLRSQKENALQILAGTPPLHIPCVSDEKVPEKQSATAMFGKMKTQTKEPFHGLLAKFNFKLKKPRIRKNMKKTNS